jgi:hypothetical protein
MRLKQCVLVETLADEMIATNHNKFPDIISCDPRVLPHIGLLRGTSWESKHWHRLFSILGICEKTKVDVTLKDIVAKAQLISASADKIKELNAQAQNEAVIRKALDELDLWGYSRKFQQLERQDSSGAKVCQQPGPIA